MASDKAVFDSPVPSSPYLFIDLNAETQFRVLELLPGENEAPIKCFLHLADWLDPPEYEAVSYAWGQHLPRFAIKCDGKRIDISQNLYSGLTHLRKPDRSRYLWVDCLCMHQENVTERNQQVRQMRQIYEKAKAVVSWLGPDTPDGLAKAAISAIQHISDFLCERLDVRITNLSAKSNVYHEVLYEKRQSLPPPDQCEFSSNVQWQSLIWYYSHAYFSRLWIIQEINASTNRIVQCGHETVEWDRVDLVAGYIIMDTKFSKSFGFSKTYCWWAATVTTERMRNPKNWIAMLYLASNFNCSDIRDMIYGLLGLMKLPSDTYQARLMEVDYSKSIVEVFRDSVEAGLVHFQDPNILLYLVGDESPSWIPRWERPMLFRNPFRFGKALPWKSAGDSKLQYTINKHENLLHLSGLYIDVIRQAVHYNERYFDNATRGSEEGKAELQRVWPMVLDMLAESQNPPSLPIRTEVLEAAATALSFGLDGDADPADTKILLHNFVSYLDSVLPSDLYARSIPSDLSDSARRHGKGSEFGKPVWDFNYPASSLFITSTGLVGCCTCVSQPSDIVIAALGGTYPFIVRPRPGKVGYLIRGYAYVHCVMIRENADTRKEQIFSLY